MSLTDEQINLLNFDHLRALDSQQKPLLINSLDSSPGQSLPSSVVTTTQLAPTTYYNQNQHSITASVPHQPQLNTTLNMSQDLIEKSKQALQVNIQAEYQQKQPSSNIGGPVIEDDDFIPPEPPRRIDYKKKALVNKIMFSFLY